MNSVYDKLRLWKVVFFVVAVAIAIGFVTFSSAIVNDLAEQERGRMEMWARATQELAQSTAGNSNTNIEFLFSIIQDNNNIPVLLVDSDNHILMHRNFNLPEEQDSTTFELSDKNLKYLRDKLDYLRTTDRCIDIYIDKNTTQHVYYDESYLLKKLYYYPYVELVVMFMFVVIVYFAVISMKRAEQNRVWVGLSKETAHQLGTPISSLMAWMQILDQMGVEKEMVDDMDKDVKRLSKIADRFSKIGSIPELELSFLNESVQTGLEYMRARISSKVTLTIHTPDDEIPVMLCPSLFEWVLENLTKNAVDAMQAVGSITVTVERKQNIAVIDVTDTGKGIARKNFETVFNPGYTTKKRGWGLGLTLVKRIVEQYHKGKIYVKSSEIDKGTTFRIELPVVHNK